MNVVEQGTAVCATLGIFAPVWISVKDRLPAYDLEVLTIDKRGYQNVAERYKTDGAGEHWKRSVYDGEQTHDVEVAHWTPLPAKPPKASATSATDREETAHD